jgi:ABC-type uncharacterized transport system permease subunit
MNDLFNVSLTEIFSLIIMTTSIIGVASIFGYLLSTYFLLLDIKHERTTRLSLIPAWLAVLLHLLTILLLSWQLQGISFHFFNIASTLAAIITSLFLLASLSKPIGKLGIGFFPLAAILLGVNLAFFDPQQAVTHYSWPMNIHIFSSLIAFSLLNIAALQAIFLAIQDQQLRKHPPSKIILTLPPLQTMESLLFQMISAGVIFLTISLISGFLFIDDLFAQHLAHKTVLSMLAWLIFSFLLLGRIRYGWRGQTAIQWTLIGFTTLLLAYFGSKMVLELILHKS